MIGISWAAELVGGAAQAEIFTYVDQIRDVGVIGFLAWFAVRLKPSNMKTAVTSDTRTSDTRTGSPAKGARSRSKTVRSAAFTEDMGPRGVA